MSGYVVSARIDRRPARLARARAALGAADDDRATATGAWIEAPAEDRAGGPAVRWAALRERWSQLTFYLFDPNSWR